MVMDTVHIPLPWHEAITGINQTFESIAALRIVLMFYSTTKYFVFKYVKNDLQRLTVECAKKERMECAWRLHACLIKKRPIWAIKKYTGIHTCDGSLASDGHPCASCKWVARFLQSILRQRPTYRLVDAKKDILEQYGISLSYSIILHGRELAQTELYGHERRSYDLLRWYESKVSETNPDSVITIHAGDNTRFKRMFVCYRACYDVFIDGCRRLLFLNGTFIKDRSKGILLTATAYDANNGLWPLIFCICDSQDTSNWFWFLGQLNGILFNGSRTYVPSHELVFISDSDKGLKEAVKTWFPDALHAFCIQHLVEYFWKKLKDLGVALVGTQVLGQMMNNVAYKCSFRDFQEDFDLLRRTSEFAYDALLRKYPLPEIGHGVSLIWEGSQLQDGISHPRLITGSLCFLQMLKALLYG